jgi:hypothetical protein
MFLLLHHLQRDITFNIKQLSCSEGASSPCQQLQMKLYLFPAPGTSSTTS